MDAADLYAGDEAAITEEHLHPAGSAGRPSAACRFQPYHLQHQVSHSLSRLGPLRLSGRVAPSILKLVRCQTCDFIAQLGCATFPVQSYSMRQLSCRINKHTNQTNMASNDSNYDTSCLGKQFRQTEDLI